MCCLLSGCYAEHDGLLECDGPEETTWPCEGDVIPPVLPGFVCHLEDGTWMAGYDGDQPVHCEEASLDGYYAMRAASCVEPGVRARQTSVCGLGPDVGAFDHGRPHSLPPFPIELRPGTCGRILGLGAETSPFVPRTEYAELCDDPLARCGAPLVFEVALSREDGCGGMRELERCRVGVDGNRLVVSIESARRSVDGCEAYDAQQVATCVAPPLGAGTYTVLDTTGRVLGDLEVPLEQDAPREPRCIAIE